MYITDEIKIEIHVGFPNGHHFAKGISIHKDVPHEELEHVLTKTFELVTKQIVYLEERK